MKTIYSETLYERARELMPGGVNSPVRAFQSVGGIPRFIHRAKEQYLYDEDGNVYIDYIGSWGSMILGHNPDFVIKAVKEQLENGLSYGIATALEVEMAELITQMVPCVEMIRMVNSGTEAVMSAIRVARGFTGRDKIVKFEGCYHGHADAMLVKAGSGVMTAGIPDSSGVPKGCTADTLSAVYNDLDSVEALFSKFPNEIACVIVEPVAANMGVVVPQKGFLQGLRRICSQGAYGGKKDIMQMVSPLGSVYQAGTLSGNPIAMCAGMHQLRYLKHHPEVYHHIGFLSHRLRSGLEEIIEHYHVPCTVNGIGSLTCLYFTKEHVTNYALAKSANTDLFRDYFHFMLDNGNYFGPSQFEAVFVSNAHTLREIDKTLSDADLYFASVFGKK